MTCRNYIPGPNGDCQRCGEMRAGHAGRDLAKELIEGAEEVKEYVRAGHAGSMDEILQHQIKRGDTVWDTRKEWYNIIADRVRTFPRWVVVGQDGRTIPMRYASRIPPAKSK